MSKMKREVISWLLLIALGINFTLPGCQPAHPQLPRLAGNLPIAVRKTITAGEPVTITLGPTVAHDGMQATLIVMGSYGPRVYQAQFQHGLAYFMLSGQETQQSGSVSLTALADKARGTAQFLINPSNPVEPLTPLIGARAIIADAEHWNMTVLVPFDAFGNPIMEGTRVEVLVLHPGNRLEKKHLVVRNLLAWTRVFSGTRAGRALVVALIGQVHGFEGRMLEVAGWPVTFAISAAPQPLSADGRLLTTLRTGVIHDKFGNVMPDGTWVTFIVEAPDGTFDSIPAQTIGGIAEALLQAPRLPGDYSVRATILGVESAKIVVHFTAGPAVGVFPIMLKKDPAKLGYVLQAGPLLGSLGQYIPDGTPVRFIITNAKGQSQELDDISNAGYADVEMRPTPFPAGIYKVQVVVGSAKASSMFTLK